MHISWTVFHYRKTLLIANNLLFVLCISYINSSYYFSIQQCPLWSGLKLQVCPDQSVLLWLVWLVKVCCLNPCLQFTFCSKKCVWCCTLILNKQSDKSLKHNCPLFKIFVGAQGTHHLTLKECCFVSNCRLAGLPASQELCKTSRTHTHAHIYIYTFTHAGTHCIVA